MSIFTEQTIELDIEPVGGVAIIQIVVNGEMEFVLTLKKNDDGKTAMRVVTDEVSDPPKWITVVAE